MQETREIAVPNDAMADPDAHEVLRAWTDRTEYVRIAGRLYKDPATWGHLLCQIARHVARAYDLNGFNSREEVLGAIHKQFNETWEEADDGTGSLSTNGQA
ncbi:MAG: DUF5076 domain-containing protein [Phycisphaeraceae bacterium]|nr:DUF5076 domain-containing protein [Phycisphaeraceae bacterium]